METTLRVSGMTCDHCKASVTRALASLDGVSRVEVDLRTGTVRVVHDAGAPPVAAMREAVEELGFEVVG